MQNSIICQTMFLRWRESDSKNVKRKERRRDSDFASCITRIKRDIFQRWTNQFVVENSLYTCVEDSLKRLSFDAEFVFSNGTFR